MIDLHYVATPNGQKISIMLEEIGLPYNVILYDIFQGDQHTAEFGKINPNHKLPAIVDNDPAGFYRKGNTDSWAEELSPQDVRVVEYIAGDLMHEYGYTTVAESGRNHKKPWRLRRRELLTSIEWRVNRTIGALFHKSHQA